MAKHTAGKWKFNLRTDVQAPFALYVLDDDGADYEVAVFQIWTGAHAEQQANAEFICTACNKHDGLVETLRTIKCQCEREEAGDIQFDTIDWIRQKAQAALAGIKEE